MLKHYWNGPGSEIPEYVNWEPSNSLEGQDRWVLNVLGGKNNGTYLEIGAGHPIYGNNTYLLENSFNWTGLSIEIEETMVSEFLNTRNNPCICSDATSIDYRSNLAKYNMPKRIDYLQIDIDDKPVNANLLGLIGLPLAEYRFSALTIEHGCLSDYKNSRLRDAQRLILESFGYRLIVQGVNEDWWIDPTSVPYEKYGYMFSVGRIFG
jgi:hypothetical protein